jgi:hypothetical protein
MNITALLQRAGAADHEAEDQMIPLVYDERKCIAAGYLLRRSHHASLRPAALVHETSLRMYGSG